MILASHSSDDLLDFFLGHDGRQALGALRANGIDRVFEIFLEHFPVEEEQGAERLILGGGRHVTIDRQMVEEHLNLGAPHMSRMSLAMKKNEPPYP